MRRDEEKVDFNLSCKKGDEKHLRREIMAGSVFRIAAFKYFSVPKRSLPRSFFS